MLVKPLIHSRSVKSLNSYRTHNPFTNFDDESTQWCKTSKVNAYKSVRGFKEFKNEHLKNFKAQKIPITHTIPFIVYKSTKPLTECKDIKLETENRSLSRSRGASFNKRRPEIPQKKGCKGKISKNKPNMTSNFASKSKPLNNRKSYVCNRTKRGIIEFPSLKNDSITISNES